MIELREPEFGDDSALSEEPDPRRALASGPAASIESVADSAE